MCTAVSTGTWQFLGQNQMCSHRKPKPAGFPAQQPHSRPRFTASCVALSCFPANIRSSCLRLRASTTAKLGCWMVNCSSEGSGFSILAGAWVRQAACFAVPGCLGYCCAFYRYSYIHSRLQTRSSRFANTYTRFSPLTASCPAMQQR